MTIVFPTTEPKGLQAKRALYFESAVYYTFVETNDKGGITCVKNIEKDDLKNISIDTIVTKFPLQNEKFQNSQIIIDALSPNVDTALIKVLREKLFCKSA